MSFTYNEELVEIMVTMLATSTSVEECGMYARNQLRNIVPSQETWIVIVGVIGSFDL